RAGGIYPGTLPLDSVEVLGSDDGVTTSLQLSRNSRTPMLDHQDKYMMKAQVHIDGNDKVINDDDDDVDEYFLLDKENKIVEPDVDVYLFGISMYLPFDNIGITNLVPGDVLEGEDVDVINANGFDSDPGNDEERNYKKRRLAELRTKMEGVINASGQWKYSFYTGQKFTSPKEAKDRVYLHFIESRRNLKLYKNDSVKIRARCEGKVPVFTMSQDYVVELQSTNPNTTVKIAVERNIDPFLPTRVFQRIYVCLGALKLGFRVCRRDLLGLDGAFMKGPFPGQVLVAVRLDSNNRIYPLAYALVEAETKSSWCWFLQCLGDDIDLHPNLNFAFISDRQKGIISAIKNVYPSAEHRYCLRHIHENMKQGWCGQAYKDLLWRAASATNVRDLKNVEPNLTYCSTTSVRKGRTITCQSCGNIGHNKATCKGQGRKATIGGNNAEGSGSASRQAQQTEPAVGQDDLGGSGAGAVIGLFVAIGEGGAGDPGGAGVSSQGLSHTRWTRRRVQTEIISLQKRTPTQPASQPFTSSQVPVSQTRNKDGKEMGDGVPMIPVKLYMLKKDQENDKIESKRIKNGKHGEAGKC
nr:transposase, mutator type [Tanacetum cinerariifolium]